MQTFDNSKTLPPKGSHYEQAQGAYSSANCKQHRIGQGLIIGSKMQSPQGIELTSTASKAPRDVRTAAMCSLPEQGSLAKQYNISDFDFHLPKELIAQRPTKERHGSKLLVCLDASNPVEKDFTDILSYIKSSDLIIFNDSQVINSQLSLYKERSTGKEMSSNIHRQYSNASDCKNNLYQRKIVVNLYKQIDEYRWEAMARPAKYLKPGDEFIFGQHKLILESKGQALIFRFDLKAITVFNFLEEYGMAPLPPYIKRSEDLPEDKERYQSIFAKYPGSVAAPTASLHFSQKILDGIEKIGAETCFVTLHVGAGTYLPIKNDDIDNHVMHSEYASISKEVADKINKAKSECRRIIAVGTTSIRVLESFANKSRSTNQDLVISHGTQNTNIFIKPGHTFAIADMLVTNFHLPKSTLFMLVCAFAGTQHIHTYYKYAIEKKMRFFSYGDAMLLKLQQTN